MTRDEVFRKRLGSELRNYRGERKQGGVARMVGITQASLSNYETGKRDIPLVTAFLLAQELDFSVDALLARVSS